MNKLLILMIAVLFLMLPLASFTKTAIDDDELDKVTAEEGVSVGFNNFSVGGTASLAKTSWGDSSGYSTYNTPGYAGVNPINISGNLSEISGTANIDVGTSGAVTGVMVNLPTIKMGAMNVNATMRVTRDLQLAGTAGSPNELGKLNMQGFSTRIAGDCVKLFAH